MYSSTAYEALYTYIGLNLHSISVEMLTSYQFLIAMILLVFAMTMFFVVYRYFSKYFPGVKVIGGSASLFSVFKVIGCLFLGMMLLKVDTSTSITNFKNQSWHSNSYTKTRLPEVEPEYRVSLIFDILSRSSEEVAKFFNGLVDNIFIATNSQVESPGYFYKAIMYAGSATIDDPILKDKVAFYTEECFEVAIPRLSEGQYTRAADRLFNPESISNLLDEKVLANRGAQSFTCLDLSNEISGGLRAYSKNKTGKIPTGHISYWSGKMTLPDDKVNFENHYASSALANYYAFESETYMGIKTGSEVPGLAADAFRTFDRVFSWDGILSMLTLSDARGAATAATKAQEFSELLQRAPHIKGVVKMTLIAIFPWLVFFVIAGRWKILIYWTAVYGSVLLWEPIWTLSYHVITHIAITTEVLANYEGLRDGFSIYGSEIINSRMYFAYSVYSWVQLVVGPLPTIIVAGSLRGMLSRPNEDNAPSLVKDTVETVKKV